MVRYNGRNKLLTSAVNGNQIGLKMGGAAPSVGSAISTRRHTKRRVRDNLKFCGPVYYRGQLWNFNTENCVVRAPITQASAGGVGHINHPRKKCNSNCSLEKCNIADSIKLVRQYFIKKYGEDGIALVAPAETLASDGINEHINGPILHFDPNHSPYYTLPQNIREAVDCINALELKYRLKDSPDKKRHIVGHITQDTQQALRAAYFGNFMETFGSETIYAFGYGVERAGLKTLVIKYLEAQNGYLTQYPNKTAIDVANALSLWGEWNNSGYAHIGDIPTGPVKDMSNLFNTDYDTSQYGASAFNQPLNSWDTSRVTNMSAMFSGATAFKQSLDKWDTSRVTNMSAMFKGAAAFNQPLNSWDTSRVTNMSAMFKGAAAFNQPINGKDVFNQDIAYSSWNTRSVTDMSYMFYGATAFDQPLDKWLTDNVQNMSNMFNGAAAFGQYHGDIGTWKTGKVTNMSHMFKNAYAFNNSIKRVVLTDNTVSWDTKNVTDMSFMFYGATAFDKDISSWFTSTVTDMSYMFNDATAFDQPLNAWSTAYVTNMSGMFRGASKFNQGLNSWFTYTSNVKDMSYMFYGATAFDQNISNWKVASVKHTTENGVLWLGARCFTNAGSLLAVAPSKLPRFSDAAKYCACLPTNVCV